MIKKQDIHKTVRRPYPPLYSSLMFMGEQDDEAHEIYFISPSYIKNTAIVEGVWYYSMSEIKKMGKLVFKKWNSEEKLKQVIELFKKKEKELIDSTKISIRKYVKSFVEYMPGLVPIYAVEKQVYNKLRELLLSKFSEKEVDELMDILNLPFENNIYKKEGYELVTTEDLKKHVKKYESVRSRYGEEAPYTLEMAKEHLKTIDKTEFLKKFKEEKEKVKQAVKRAEKGLGASQRYLVDFLQFLVYFRTHRTDILNKSFYLLIPKVKQAAEKNNLSYSEILHATIDELLSKKIPEKEVLKERIKDHVILMDDGEIKICHEQEDLNKFKKYFEGKVEDVKELKGKVASKGEVKGKAKLVFDKGDFDKIQAGDILVTSMTTPEMVPIMNKAAAFVTDEGGVTCHAAIISREMNKPCIIGTKNATKILKDGMEVEVDADNGVVRILEKK